MHFKLVDILIVSIYNINNGIQTNRYKGHAI
jgi:hypothetical protein